MGDVMFELGMLLIISLYSPLSVEFIRFLFAEYVQFLLTIIVLILKLYVVAYTIASSCRVLVQLIGD